VLVLDCLAVSKRFGNVPEKRAFIDSVVAGPRSKAMVSRTAFSTSEVSNPPAKERTCAATPDAWTAAQEVPWKNSY